VTGQFQRVTDPDPYESIHGPATGRQRRAPPARALLSYAR
jgi:hypothetical protein